MRSESGSVWRNNGAVGKRFVSGLFADRSTTSNDRLWDKAISAMLTVERPSALKAVVPTEKVAGHRREYREYREYRS